MIFHNQAELDKALELWQGILRLRDWEVKASIVRKSQMNRSDANAEIAVYEQPKRATIQIIEPEDYYAVNDKLWEYDMERYLVHELLHIPLKALTPDDDEEPTKYVLLEQFVESAASSFINLARRHKTTA